MGQPIDPNVFVEVVKPGLELADAARVARDVARHWTAAEICPLLAHPQSDIRRVAAVVLGLVGDMTTVPCLARALKNEDPQLNQMAEHSLWSIWFRSGSCKAASSFRQGVALIGSENYRQALTHLRQAIRIDPNYAEAYNQSAIAHFFLDEHAQAIHYCKLAVKLVPVHFGAIAGLGHCHMHLGELDKALHYYKWSLRINPHMPAIAAAVQRIQQQIRDNNDSSGMFSMDALRV